MSLAVPGVLIPSTVSMRPYRHDQPQANVSEPLVDPGEGIVVKFDSVRYEILFEDQQICPVHRGDWVILSNESRSLFAGCCTYLLIINSSRTLQGG